MAPEIALHERLSLAGKPAHRGTPEAFLASFDVARVPAQPGCYLMHDERDQVIYVGKAKNLRARIRSYLNESDERYTVRFLMRRVAHIDFFVTTTEKEAILLENSLIKTRKPRYNIQLKDDKTYVSVRFDVRQEFPRLTVTRRPRKDGARYFGPYASARAVRQTLRDIQRVWPLRTCSDSVLNNRTRPCLYYQMGQCVAPCVGYATRAEYHELVDQTVLALEGRSAELEKRLLDQMQQHAAALEFEKAAAMRDRLSAFRKTVERQRTWGQPGAGDTDVFGVYTEGRYSELQVLHFRNGKMTDGRSWTFKQREMPVDEILASFLMQYYGESGFVPGEVLTPVALEDADTLAEILSEERGTKVTLIWPQRGDKRALVEMASRNAEQSFLSKQMREKANDDLLTVMKDKLRLRRLPRRIECFDIATVQGREPVGAMVVFDTGNPDKARYRRFSIKSVAGQDDFGMMREVLLRRYTRAVKEDDLPDLVVVDGGKGQLNVALAVMKDLGIEDLDVVALAKARTEDAGRSPERFFLPGQMNPVVLPQNAPIVLYLARIRDETHRFVNTYHRKKRGKAALRTTLTEVPGIGARRAQNLLKALGSVTRVRTASVDEIAAVPGFNETLARALKDHLASGAGQRGGPET